MVAALRSGEGEGRRKGARSLRLTDVHGFVCMTGVKRWHRSGGLRVSGKVQGALGAQSAGRRVRDRSCSSRRGTRVAGGVTGVAFIWGTPARGAGAAVDGRGGT